MEKAAFKRKKNDFTSKSDFNLRKKLVKFYIWSIALHGAETWTLRKVDQKYLESFGRWCYRRMEKISWTDHVRNEEVLQGVKEQRSILQTIKKQKANCTGQVLHRNCLATQRSWRKDTGKIEATERREGRRKQLLDDLKQKRGYSELKQEVPDPHSLHSLWKRLWTCRKTNCRMNEDRKTLHVQ